MQIKRMEKKDIPSVVRLGENCFSRFWKEEEYLRTYGQQDKIYLVACGETGVVASCAIWCSFETADLCNVAVDEKFRRRGIAMEMLRHGLEECRQKGIERVLLEVRESNQAAIGLYQRLCFREISRRSQYYHDPVEDALIMEVLL
jgi:ribosomal-protein-alanine N-acetyltransferase